MPVNASKPDHLRNGSGSNAQRNEADGGVELVDELQRNEEQYE